MFKNDFSNQVANKEFTNFSCFFSSGTSLAVFALVLETFWFVSPSSRVADMRIRMLMVRLIMIKTFMMMIEDAENGDEDESENDRGRA